MSKEHENWKHAVAGTTAGLASVLALQPLDVVKTRLQVQDGIPGPLSAYRGTVHALKSIVKEEGWRALYSGLGPGLLGAGLSWGLYFSAYNRAKERYQKSSGQTKLAPQLHLLSAAEAGCLVCCVTNPIWVIKTRLQLQRGSGPTVSSRLRPTVTHLRGNAGPYRGFVHAVKQIAQEEGIRGFYKGLLPSLFLVSHGAIQFMVYEELKALTAGAGEYAKDTGRSSLSVAQISVMGAISKLSASVVTYPSQVVRARLQQRQAHNRAVQYRDGLATFKLIMQREGTGGLYKGLVPNVLRVMPQSAITFLVYEKENFDLQTYDQLVQPDVYEAALAAHMQRNTGAAVGKFMTEKSQQKAASLALLAAAFDAFPDKDYCLLTLPPDSPELPLLATFTRLVPPPGSSLVEVLYLCHRFSLLEDFQVQSATRAHVEGVQDLLTGVADMSVTMTTFTHGVEANSAYVVSCQSQVIGMATIQPFTDLSQLQHSFHVASVPGLTQDGAANKHVMLLTSFCLNPIFAHRAEQFLLDILKRCNGHLLLYLLSPDQASIEVLRVFRQVAPRHRLQGAPATLQPEFALFAFWHEASSRTPVNSHVVVAGASVCGLSVIESLLMHETLAFNALTLLAPGGHCSGQPAAMYKADLIVRLGLHASVNVLDVELVSIDREQQTVVLSDNRTLQYGVLVLSMGLSCEAMVLNQSALGLPQVVSLPMLPGRIQKGVKATKSIIVHGPISEACTAMAQLEAAGVNLQSARYLRPSRQAEISLAEEAAGLMLPAAAQAAGVALPAARQVSNLEVQRAEDNSKVVVTATGSSGESIVEEADLLVVAAAKTEVPGCIVKAAAQNNLVCDGRLVVDAAFRTNDPKIFAAGTIAKFSRRYGTGLCHSRYNSQEVGQKAAESIAATFNSPFLGDSALPKLQIGRLTTTALPGGGVFAYAHAAGGQHSSLMDTQGHRRLVSQTQHGYCQLTLEASGIIQSALLCTAKKEPELPPELLLPLVGLSVSYLHELLHNYEAGSMPDVPYYLRQPWTSLLYHDRFPQLRSALLQNLVGTGQPLQELDGNSIGASDETEVACVQNDVVGFLKLQGASEFPQYAVSAYIS
ncbi:hypothetical protein WJX77_008705 [Trebouxia sp. C0004]